MLRIFEEKPEISRRSLASRTWQEFKGLRVPVEKLALFSKELEISQIHNENQKTDKGQYNGEVMNKQIKADPHGYGRFISYTEPQIREG